MVKIDQLNELIRAFVSTAEAARLLAFLKAVMAETVMESPWALGIFFATLLFGLLRRSRFVLLFLFTVLASGALIHFNVSAESGMDAFSAVSLAGGHILIFCVLIYFGFMK